MPTPNPPDQRAPSPLERESAEDFARLVIALIEIELVRCDDWVAWATDELMRAEGAPAWLAELTITYSIADTIDLLYGVANSPTVPERLGCLFLTYEESASDGAELLDSALNVAGGWDTGGGFIPYQQELMRLLTRLANLDDLPAAERRGGFDTIEREAVALLLPLGEQVRSRAAQRIRMSGLPEPNPAMAPQAIPNANIIAVPGMALVYSGQNEDPPMSTADSRRRRRRRRHSTTDGRSATASGHRSSRQRRPSTRAGSSRTVASSGTLEKKGSIGWARADSSAYRRGNASTAAM